jgi:hypothetical protein
MYIKNQVFIPRENSLMAYKTQAVSNYRMNASQKNLKVF